MIFWSLHHGWFRTFSSKWTVDLIPWSHHLDSFSMTPIDLHAWLGYTQSRHDCMLNESLENTPTAIDHLRVLPPSRSQPGQLSCPGRITDPEPHFRYPYRKIHTGISSIPKGNIDFGSELIRPQRGRPAMVLEVAKRKKRKRQRKRRKRREVCLVVLSSRITSMC